MHEMPSWAHVRVESLVDTSPVRYWQNGIYLIEEKRVLQNTPRLQTLVVNRVVIYQRMWISAVLQHPCYWEKLIAFVIQDKSIFT